MYVYSFTYFKKKVEYDERLNMFKKINSVYLETEEVIF